MPATLETEGLLSEDQQQEESTSQELQAAEKIRVLYKGVKLRRKQTLASSKQLSKAQKQTAAQAIGTDVDRLSMSKTLYEAREAKVKAYRAADAAINEWFKDANYTLPTSTPGMRLVKKGKTLLDDQHEVTEQTKTELGFWEVKYKMLVDGKIRVRRVVIDQDEHMRRVRSSFQAFKANGLQLIELARRAAHELQEAMPEIIERERARLKSAFNAADYSFRAEECGWEISFPCIEPDPELAEIDPQTFKEEGDRTVRFLVEVQRLEIKRIAETMVKHLDALSLALSQRELLDREHEVTSKKTLDNGKTEVAYKDADKKAQTVQLTAAELQRRISVDSTPRKFNTETAARLYGAAEEIKRRKAEEGVENEDLDRALSQLQRMLRGETAETFPEALREDLAGYGRQVEETSVAIAATLLESSTMEPRRALLRRQLKHPALQKDA